MQKDLIEPAVHGTKNLLGSVTKHKSTVKRVVLTSSLAGKCTTQMANLNCIKPKLYSFPMLTSFKRVKFTSL